MINWASLFCNHISFQWEIDITENTVKMEKGVARPLSPVNTIYFINTSVRAPAGFYGYSLWYHSDRRKYGQWWEEHGYTAKLVLSELGLNHGQGVSYDFLSLYLEQG